MSSPSEMSLFLGRLHPLLVHLPIGLILLLGLFELLALIPRFKQAAANRGLMLALAVPAAIASAVCGWLLSRGGGYQDQLLQWHKWTGIATAAFCLTAGLFYALGLTKLYRWPLAASVATLFVAGHFGGSLTHGSDYLTKYAPAPLRRLLAGRPEPPPVAAKTADPAQLEAFAGIVQPILENNCVSCHGPDKSKGKLRLDSYAAALKGGGSGLAIVPGKPAESGLVKRIHLPLADEDHMPPEGKPQPSPDELALLQWWVEAGAPQNRKAGELSPPQDISRILGVRFGRGPSGPPAGAPVAKAVPPKPLDTLLPAASRLADDLGIVITPLAQNEPWLECNASVAGTNFGDVELARLSPFSANLRWLDLAGTSVSDAGLSNCAAMPNLARLHLERTGVGDGGLPALAGLAGLEYLNLYGTPVSDAGLAALCRLPKLKQLYLWRSKVTPEAAQKFADARENSEDIRKWQAEIESLKARIADAKITVDVGIPTAVAVAASEPKPINTACPVSGKPIDPAQTVAYQGKRVAFCCADCKAKFEHDPKPFLAKLDLAPKDEAKK